MTNNNQRFIAHVEAGLNIVQLDNVKGRGHTNNTVGLPLGGGVEWVFTRFSALGLTLNYNINSEQNYRTAFLSLRFGRLRN